MVCSYNLVTMFIPLNSFETWAAFYDWNTERIFLSVKTICEITNMVLFLIYIVILMMKDRRERERIKLLNEQLQKANEQLHEFAQEKELMGETKERNRLAREIHDTLGHILTGISVGIDAVLVLMDIAPDKAKEQLEGIGDTARRGLQDVRRSVRKLKPDALERMSLNNAIHQMIEDMSKVTNTKIYFVSYMEEKVSFPWSMIDKITPRPDEKVKEMLEKDGFEDTDLIITSRNTYTAPFVNSEETGYLVIEDNFPNGRPPLEKAGIVFTDRETVDKVEKMKVCTCLNPLHTALAIYGCMLGHTSIHDEMEDKELSRLIQKMCYEEAMPA